MRIRKEGVVTVSSRRTELCHEIEISDNGKGFDMDLLKTADGTHIGVRNVRERIEKTCGGTLTVKSVMDSGTTVTIRIPIKESR